MGFYTEGEAKWFFGRMTERRIILSHLRTARLTLLYAESGVGKSSLLRAGVAARLRELARRSEEASRSPRFVPVVFSAWKDEPVEDLIAEIARLGGGVQASNGAPKPAPTGSRSALASAIRDAANALDATLVVILDQFEEHFSYRLAHRSPDRLADELAECINSPDVPANFLIAVREDAYGRLGDLFSGRIGNVYNNYLHLEYMTREAARDAIEKPVQTFNGEHDPREAISFDQDLADAVLDEVRRGNLELGARRPDRDSSASWGPGDGDKIETPFLQLVMTRLWECERAQGSRVLRRATLNGQLGGAETIVRNHVSRALAGLAGLELEAATDIFGDLVTPSGVKVAHTVDDLAQMTAHSHETVEAVVARLYEERILRAVDPAPGTSEPRYEIYHDRLAGPILDWRDEQQNGRLEQAKQLAELEAETQRAQARRFKRRAWIMLGLAVGLVVLLGAAGGLWLYARNQSIHARQETAEATYVGLTARAQSQLISRPDISLLLDLAAYRVRRRPIAERSLVATLAAVKDSGTIGILHGHTDAVESVAFSPSGTMLASASADRTVRLWRVTPQRHYPLGAPLRAGQPLYDVAFAPNGRTLASGSYNEVILWNLARRAKQETIPFDHGAVSSVAFTRTGSLLAAGGSDGTVLLWNNATRRARFLPVKSRGPVRSIAFSPDGQILA
ncbi:MAG TPA: AAA family ATPase, partial [Solirubrobacteraceae bacterium]|nr:AAA family ATPase [Solirubrobacteraceae bacterium]